MVLVVLFEFSNTQSETPKDILKRQFGNCESDIETHKSNEGDDGDEMKLTDDEIPMKRHKLLTSAETSSARLQIYIIDKFRELRKPDVIQDENDHFGMYIASCLKKLKMTDQVEARMPIQEITFKFHKINSHQLSQKSLHDEQLKINEWDRPI